MRKLIVAIIAFILLLGGYIVYMEIDKKKFIDTLAPPPPIVNQPVNLLETTREVTQANEEPKFQEVDPDELLSAVNRIPEQFGYSEASKTYAKLEAKKMSGEALTIDEKVARLEAALYLWPNEYTRRSLMLNKFIQSKGPDFHPKNGFSKEDIAQLQKLDVPVIWRGNEMIVNPMPDYIREDIHKEVRKKYAHIFNDPKYFPPQPSTPESIPSEGIGEDIDLPSARSEEIPITAESQVSGTPDHIHQEEGHVHETPTIQPLRPAAAKSVEDSGREGLSKVQQELVKQFFDEYGTEEGLRRLWEMDPDTARRFERERRPVPSRDVPDGERSESGSKD